MYKTDLLKLIKKHEKGFFTDSIFQFCCREPEVGGYFAYDEDGIFFIYDKDMKGLLTDLGYSNKKAELLSDAPHRHIRPKGCEKKLSKFKEELKRKSVFSPMRLNQMAAHRRRNKPAPLVRPATDEAVQPNWRSLHRIQYTPDKGGVF